MSRWSEFYKRHGSRNFTPTFNSYLDALMDDSTAGVPERVDAWVLRTSWGNFSDHCVDREGGLLGQSDCARRLRLDRRQVNPIFIDRERRGYLRMAGKEIHPIDDPAGLDAESGEAGFASSSLDVDTFRTNSEEKVKVPFGEFVKTIWAQEHPDEYREYQKIERLWSKFRTRLLNEWRLAQRKAAELSEGSMTNGDTCPGGIGQAVAKVQDKTSGEVRTNRAAILITETGNSKQLASVSPKSPEQRIEAVVGESCLDQLQLDGNRHRTITKAAAKLATLPPQQREHALERLEADLSALGRRRDNRPKSWGILVTALDDAIRAVEDGKPQKRGPQRSAVPDYLVPSRVRALRAQIAELEVGTAAESEIAPLREMLQREESEAGIRTQKAGHA